MRSILLSVFTLAIAGTAAAQPPLAEVGGNWAGASNQGFYFLARLTPNEDKARLQIWGGALDAVPSGQGEPEFDNDRIALGASATRQALEVSDTGTGAILNLVTEFADETGEGRSVVQIAYIDFQYTVVGYYFRLTAYDPAMSYECDVDLEKGVIRGDGPERKLDPVPAEELNASDWAYDTAFERGYCTPPG